MSTHLTRPSADEFSGHYGTYIDLVPEGPILEILARQMEETQALLAPLDEARAGHRYAPGKWSIKEVVGHLIDCEWVFAYRGLTFARGDRTPLPGFDQDAFIAAADFDRRPLPELLRELATLRTATISLFQSWNDAAALRRGVANSYEMSARCVPYVVAGHELHHRTVLSERYL